MDIVSRLKIFLQENGISNSLFADNCGIPRPTLSQLLNGRNKKVSDELIAKIHAAYPMLNVMWLMFGDGDMFVPNANNSANVSAAQPGENAIEFSSPNKDAQNQNRQTTINFGGGERDDFHGQQRAFAPMSQNAMADVFQSLARTTAASKGGSQRGSAATGDRRVVSIMVLYSDGRFENFVPQS
ncbi:MAG: helix-turn-helix domain-containing protein [Muribaculaceae bacterium]|nr:helix-turn-helix domain-containing protein [Muribaculaceae bacterium]